MAKVRNQYNQIQHRTQDSIWEKTQNTRKYHIQERQTVRLFPVDDYKAARNRQDSNTDKHAIQIKQKDPQKKQSLEKVSKKITGGLSHVWRHQPQIFF